ncbi:hypothetical protein JCM16303_006497 [Sporobolomyces ruberrimus]
MRSVFAIVALFSLLMSTRIFVIGQQINSPTSLTVCTPQQLIINGGSPPYDVAGKGTLFHPSVVVLIKSLTMNCGSRRR